MDSTEVIEKKEPIIDDKKVVDDKKPVIAKAGAPVAAPFTPATPTPAAATAEPGNMGGAATVTETEAQKEARLKAEKEAKPVVINEDAIKTYLETQGIKVNSLDEIKKKFETPAAELTDEEKKAAESSFEQRMVAKFVAEGGTVDEYAAYKLIANMDAKQLAQQSTVKELRDAGFDDTEIAQIIKQRYYQLGEELQRGEDEAEADFEARKKSLEKKSAFFTKKFESRNSHIKTDAEKFINTLREAVKSEDSQKAKETSFLSSVDESLKKLSRDLTLDLGKVDDQQIDPVPIKVTDEHIASVKAILNDPVQRKQYFINADISKEELGRAVNIILRNVALESFTKAAYLEGGTREVAKFKKIFPDSASAIGVGGAPKKQTGKVASAGAPVYAQPKGAN